MVTTFPKRESILQEMILRLLVSGKYAKALEELELCVPLFIAVIRNLILFARYLPSSPYEDNPTLHTYAGLVCIYLAQPDVSKVQQGSQQGEFQDQPSTQYSRRG